MMQQHSDLPDAGRVPNYEIDAVVERLRAAPVLVTGARDAPEEALASLLAALESLGLIADSTSAS
jgi:hypothetical protein